MENVIYSKMDHFTEYSLKNYDYSSLQVLPMRVVYEIVTDHLQIPHF